jgi:predicted transcriptional regulator YheO
MDETDMPSEIQGLKFLADGILKLFHPFVEVVIHHLDKNKILYLAGASSSRTAGESSYLSKADRSLPPGVYGPYSKTSSEGKAMKSVSIVFSFEKSGRTMMCINYDVSEFQQVQSLMGALTSFTGMKSLEEVFDENWQDKIHKYINEILIEKGLTMSQLSRDDKKELVFGLRKRGAFNGKNAAAYIAQILKVSRASIYSYLKE